MYEQLKAELKEIVELVESLPERYRDKCFDLLLAQLLASEKKPAPNGRESLNVEKSASQGPPKERDVPSSDFVVPAKVKVLLQRQSVTEESLKKIVLVENGEVHFVKEPKDVKIAEGQIEWTLLCALRSALLGKELLVDAEEIRSLCQEKGFYDRPNFAANFKREKNAELFQKVPQPQGEPVKLSSKGEEELAKLVARLAG